LFQGCATYLTVNTGCLFSQAKKIFGCEFRLQAVQIRINTKLDEDSKLSAIAKNFRWPFHPPGAYTPLNP